MQAHIIAFIIQLSKNKHGGQLLQQQQRKMDIKPNKVFSKTQLTSQYSTMVLSVYVEETVEFA